MRGRRARGRTHGQLRPEQGLRARTARLRILGREPREETGHPAVGRQAVVARDGLEDAEARGDSLDEADAEREGDLVLEGAREGLGDDDRELVTVDGQGEEDVPLRHVRRDEGERALGRFGQRAAAGTVERVGLGQDGRQRLLVRARHLEEVGEEIAAVQDLPGERFLHLAKARDFALDEQ